MFIKALNSVCISLKGECTMVYVSLFGFNEYNASCLESEFTSKKKNLNVYVIQRTDTSCENCKMQRFSSPKA